MTLAIIESYSRRDHVPLGEAGVDADPRAGRQAAGAPAVPGAGAKPRSGSSALTRASIACPRADRRVALEPAARGDVELQLDQVEAGRRLGHRVLHLEARVDLEEGERALARAGRGTRRCRRCGTRPPATRSTADAPQRPLLLRRPAPATPTPRSASGCGAGPSSRARPRAQALPWSSAMTCTSTWRAPVTSRSISTLASPNARRASSRARSRAGAARPPSSRIRIPRPPPPAAALIISGKPIAAAWRSASSSVSHRPAAPRGDRDPDLLGEELGARSCRRGAASPSAGGPMKVDADAARTARRTRGPRRRTPTRPRPRRRGTRAAPARARRGRCRGCPSRRARSRPTRRPRARRSPAAPRRCGGRSCGSAQPRSWLSSRAAWISRRAGSPLLTMAIRLSIRRATLAPTARERYRALRT